MDRRRYRVDDDAEQESCRSNQRRCGDGGLCRAKRDVGSRKPKAGSRISHQHHDRRHRLWPDRSCPRTFCWPSTSRSDLHVGKIPLLEGALDCIHAGHIPGGLNNNRNFAECLVEYDADVPEDLRDHVFDPQTAGGLLICTPSGDALTQALRQAGVPAVQIGEVLPPTEPRILSPKFFKWRRFASAVWAR